MADEDKDQRTIDTLRAEAEKLAAEAAVKAAAESAIEGVSRAGHGLLDVIEVALLGRVGAAEDALKAEQIRDPLDRLRAKYEDVELPKPASASPREDPVAKARAELERLKAEAAQARAAEGTDAPVKKTL